MPRLLVLTLVAACGSEPSSSTTSVGGACDGKLTVERDTTGEHVETSTLIEWTNNPPTSGPHFGFWAAWDRQYDELPRGHWVHNAEHGGVILLYNCSDCPELVENLLGVARAMPADPACVAPVTKRVIVTRDSLLPPGVQVAAVAWNHAYVASCFDDYVATFAAEHYAMAPEDFCANGASLGGNVDRPMSYTHEVSDSPIKAPASFASLPASVQLDHETWHGSGFKQQDVLPPGYHGRDEMQFCGACRSEDTRCIFFQYYHNFVESEILVEVVCNVCSKFTLHTFERL